MESGIYEVKAGASMTGPLIYASSAAKMPIFVPAKNTPYNSQQSSTSQLQIITPSTAKEESTPQETVTTTRSPPDNDDTLNSDLDDTDASTSKSDSADDEKGADHLNENITLCLFEKVQRTRNRWRTVLRAGSMHIDGHDYAFNRMNADFEF